MHSASEMDRLPDAKIPQKVTIEHSLLKAVNRRVGWYLEKCDGDWSNQ